jgi:hypothetical protein
MTKIPTTKAIDLKMGDQFDHGGGVVLGYMINGKRNAILLQVVWPEGHTTETWIPADMTFTVSNHLSTEALLRLGGASLRKAAC